MSEKLKPWKCSHCSSLLGYVEKDIILRIKRKDLYIEIEDAKKISIPCYKCGKINVLPYDPVQAA